MYILKILTQHGVYSLDREFFYFSKEKVSVGARVLINFHNQELYGYVLDVEEFGGSEEEITENYGFEMKEISKIIDKEPILSNELKELAYLLKERYFYPLIGVLQTMLPPSLRPKDTAMRAPKIKYFEYYERTNLNDFALLNNREIKFLDKFSNTRILPKSSQKPSKTLTKLLNLGFISEHKVEQNRYSINSLFEYEDKIELSKDQKEVFKEITNSNDLVYLIHGVTGSGKTEIYIKLTEKVLSENKSSLILVPEIALTPLMISRFYSYFKDGIAVLHSGLSDSQKYDEYRKISRGEARIVIGTRSAIFAPCNNLGLIIIDEENDESYKQDDQGLLYNSKEVAQIRAKMNNCKVILGSATPSIETMTRAKTGKIHYLELKERYSKVNLPNVFLVDSKDPKMYSYKSNIFSIPLIMAIKTALNSNEKVILLINSRGYSRSYSCRECGYVFKCPKCNLPLYYHKEENILYCHHCEYKVKKPQKCPRCDSTFLTYGHFGIEKVSEDFKKIFNVPFGILDSDHVKNSKQIEDILSRFDNGDFNVLIGTQIVAKGHDFKNVSLVGVLDADSLMNYPNYRSKEMAFSIITQVIGRAGRENKVGQAYIQTKNKENYLIQCAAEQNYLEFYKNEISERKKFQNPPFSSILAIDVESKKEEYSVEFAKGIFNFFLAENIDGVKVLGPSKAFKKNVKFISQVYIKYKKLSDIRETIENLIDVYKNNQKVRIRINFNPFSY